LTTFHLEGRKLRLEEGKIEMLAAIKGFKIGWSELILLNFQGSRFLSLNQDESLLKLAFWTSYWLAR
jgi:hypothetical protein